MRQRRKNPATRSPECEVLEAWIPPDPTRPYYMKVRNAFIRRFVEWNVCAGDAARLAETESLEKQWRMLADLLSHYPPSTRRREWRNLRTQPQIVRVLRHAWRATADLSRKGRPRSDLRRLAVQALDLRHSDLERWTWHALAWHFGIYKCSVASHDPECQKEWEDYRKCQKRREKDLKREAQLVINELRKLGVKLPTQRNNR